MIDFNKIEKYIDEILPEIITIRRYLHKNPELSEFEKNTSDYIAEKLKEYQIDYKRNQKDYGVVGRIQGENRDKAIGIRADIDALPIQETTDLSFQSEVDGIMHACGHDIHTAILLGTARVLNHFSSDLPYSASLFFQAAEETVGGASQLIQEGCLENPKVEKIIGLHVDPELEVGKFSLKSEVMNAASCEFFITFRGKGGHAAHPDSGNDSIVPTCKFITDIPFIMKKNFPPTDTVLVSVGKIKGGTKNNIIAEETSISGIIRTLSNDNRSKVKEVLIEYIQSLANMYHIDTSVHFVDSYPVLVNDKYIYDLATARFREKFGYSNIEIMDIPSLGADDFSYFCQDHFKGFYYNIGAKNPDEENPAPLHSGSFYVDEACIKNGILSQIVLVLSLMENG